MCRIQRFCFCATVRTGAIVGAVYIALVFVGLVIQCINGFIQANEYDKRRDESQARDLRISAAIDGVRAILALIVLVLLCIGIHKNRPGYCVPWLICVIIIIVVGTALSIMNLIRHHDWGQIINLLVYAFWCYVWIAVYSFYKDLQEGVRGPHV